MTSFFIFCHAVSWRSRGREMETTNYNWNAAITNWQDMCASILFFFRTRTARYTHSTSSCIQKYLFLA